jgi:sister-chromatid-cohesion protein PDS5
MSEIIYPAGCRSVTEDLGADELIRRLKVHLDNIFNH